MNHDEFHWLDVEFIGELLEEHHPTKDPMRISFVELKQLVQSLPGFTEQPGHPVNERILETIQQHWIDERDDQAPDDDDEG